MSKVKLTDKQAFDLSKLAYLNFYELVKQQGNLVSIIDGKYTLKQVATIILDTNKSTSEFEIPYNGGTHENGFIELLKSFTDPNNYLGSLVLKGYENDNVRKDSNPNGTGFVGLALEDPVTKNTYFAFTGSEGGAETTAEGLNKLGSMGSFLSKDWRDNFLLIERLSEQFKKVSDFVNKYKNSGKDAFATGHSKGCANAMYAATLDGVTGKGFDGPGISEHLTAQQKEKLRKSGFINYVAEGDLIGSLLEHDENRIYVDTYDRITYVPDKEEYIKTGRTVTEDRDGNGDIVSKIGNNHRLEAFKFDSNGNLTPAERSDLSRIIEGLSNALYKDNSITGTFGSLAIAADKLVNLFTKNFNKVLPNEYDLDNGLIGTLFKKAINNTYNILNPSGKILEFLGTSYALSDRFISSKRVDGTNGKDSSNFSSMSKGMFFYGKGGDDSVYGSNNKYGDILYGDSGNDYIAGQGGEDYLYGGTGNDKIFGGNDNDYLEGGTGDDYLHDNGNSDDIYYFEKGFGNDTIDDFGNKVGNNDMIMFGKGISYSDLIFIIDGDDLIIKIKNSNDSIRINDYFKGNGTHVIEKIVFNDGSEYDLKNRVFNYDGTNGNDNIDKRESSNDLNIDSKGGNDTINSGNGNDIIRGGDGRNTIHGGNGNDTIYGGKDYDSLNGNDGNDTIRGGNGSNYMYGGNGNDTMYGGDDYDSINGGNDDDTIHGGKGDDYLTGGNGNDRIFSDDGNDYLNGNYGNDNLMGGNGNNTLVGEFGDDILTGGNGNDKLIGDYENDKFNRPSFSGNNDILDGGSGNDTLIGNYGNNRFVFKRHYGHDTINDFSLGLGNRDSILFDSLLSSDIEWSANGYDLIGKIKNTNDTLTIKNALRIKDNEPNKSSFIFKDKSKTLNDLLKNFKGTDYDDKIYGDYFDKDVSMSGEKGNDYLTGGNGHDRLFGNDGNDKLFGNRGNDYLNGNNGDDQLSGGDGKDYLDGGNGNDKLDGNYGDDHLYGGNDNDNLNGGIANDYLDGGDGNDSLDGGDGNDYLDGKSGNDSLTGGNGDDTFVFGRKYGQDSIKDFRSTKGNKDKILFNNLNPSDIDWVIDGYDLIARIKGTNDSLRISNALNGNLPEGSPIEFKNGQRQSFDSILKKLKGTDKDDRINGNYFKKDTNISGGNGNDTINSGSGNDKLYGENGNDTLYGNNGSDNLYGNNDNDTLYGGNDNDYLDGGNGNDKLYGGNNNDKLYGNNGNDNLYGDYGDDYLDGGSGNDSLSGGNGNDNFVFKRGAGQDTVNDFGYSNGNVDKLKAENLKFSDLDWIVDGRDLVAKIKGTNDSMRFKNYMNTSNYDIKQFNFGNLYYSLANVYSNIKTSDNGGTLNASKLNSNVVLNGGIGRDWLYGGSGDDTLYGNSGNDYLFGNDGNDILYGNADDDTLYSNKGNDKLYGGSGNDIYFYNPGDGIDVIYDESGQKDVLYFNGFIPDELTFKMVGGNLKIYTRTANNSVTINNFNSSQNTIELFTFYKRLTNSSINVTFERDHILSLIERDKKKSISFSSKNVSVKSQAPQLIESMSTFPDDNSGLDICNSNYSNIDNDTDYQQMWLK